MKDLQRKAMMAKRRFLLQKYEPLDGTWQTWFTTTDEAEALKTYSGNIKPLHPKYPTNNPVYRMIEETTKTKVLQIQKENLKKQQAHVKDLRKRGLIQ